MSQILDNVLIYLWGNTFILWVKCDPLNNCKFSVGNGEKIHNGIKEIRFPRKHFFVPNLFNLGFLKKFYIIRIG